MGVYQNIYCIRPAKARGHGELARMANALRAFSEAPVSSGAAIHENGQLLAPDLLLRGASALTQFSDFDKALDRAEGLETGALVMRVAGRDYRANPEHWPEHHVCDLGMFTNLSGQPLTIGAPDDVSDLLDEMPELEEMMKHPPKYKGVAHDWVWLHGKAAPGDTDFMGSAIHRAVVEVWPEAIVVGDEWI